MHGLNKALELPWACSYALHWNSIFGSIPLMWSSTHVHCQVLLSSLLYMTTNLMVGGYEQFLTATSSSSSELVLLKLYCTWLDNNYRENQLCRWVRTNEEGEIQGSEHQYIVKYQHSIPTSLAGKQGVYYHTQHCAQNLQKLPNS